MERQKIFWVVLSASLLVVVVLVVGVLLLRQRPAAEASAPGAGIYEYQRETPVPGGVSTAAGGSAAPAEGQAGAAGAKPGDQQTMHFYIGEDAAAQQPAGSAANAAPAAAPAAGEAAAGAPAEQPVHQKAVAASPAPAKPAPAKTTKKVTEYWIQTGAYKSQSKAEQLASQLGAKGLSGRVFSYAVKAETWYRVRVGPYMNKAEAEKFLVEVKKFQGLESSFISQVQSTRTSVN
jgi:cell division protein FtsN